MSVPTLVPFFVSFWSASRHAFLINTCQAKDGGMGELPWGGSALSVEGQCLLAHRGSLAALRTAFCPTPCPLGVVLQHTGTPVNSADTYCWSVVCIVGGIGTSPVGTWWVHAKGQGTVES